MSRREPQIIPPIYDFSRWLGYSLISLATKIHWKAEAPLPTGPCIFVANHISHFDPPVLVTGLKPRIYTMSMVDLFQRGFQHWLHAVGAFPVIREFPDAQAARAALRLLQRGEKILIFPEGGIRSGSESVFAGGPLKDGAAALACWAQVPVVPLVCLGTDQLYAWRPGERPQLMVHQGSPISPPPARRGRSVRKKFSMEIAHSLRAGHALLRCSPLMSARMEPRSAQERWQEAKSSLIS